MPAKSAQEFTDGVCVNVHWYFGGTSYAANYEALKTALLDLRITCVRDQWSPGDSTQKNRFVDLAAAGIKHSVIIDNRRFNDTASDRAAADTDSNGAVSVAEAVNHLLNNAPGSVLSLEGPNELVSTATNCASTISQAQQLWGIKQSDPRLADIPILSPSAAHPTQNACLGDLSAITDEGNIHSYPGDYTPDASERGEPWSLRGWVDQVRAVVGTDVPITATETGYHTATTTADGHRPVSETADGKYMSQLYFAYQRLGVHRAYKYELVNEWSDPSLTNIQSHFGYLRNNLTHKPSYRSLNNVMDLLADTEAASLTPLEYSLTGAPNTVRSYLLQKSDGSHWLALWNDVPAWNRTIGQDINTADVTVTLSLAGSQTVKTYRPYQSGTALRADIGTTHKIPVGVDVTLLEIK
jgi:hypothetical protein